jgi:peptidoglycan/LPS O-acetylase OafA/YrhL
MNVCLKNEIQTQGDNNSRPVNYLPTLDGWRTIAICIVLLAHSADSINNTFLPTHDFAYIFDKFKHLGLLGVKIFFGLSGFLITTKLIGDEGLRGKISLKSFYIRRAFRILPASLVFLCTIGFLALIGVIPVSLNRWLSTLFFFANYSTAEGSWYLGHFWSLAVEEHFYFIWPLAFITFSNNSRRIPIVIGGILLIALWRAVDFKFQLTGSTAEVFWGRTDIQADYLLCGVLIALLYSDIIWRVRLQKLLTLQYVWPALLIFIFGIAIFSIPGWKIGFALLSIQALAIPLVILGTMTRSTQFPGRILESQVFRWVGRISYSLYLWQQLFLVWNESRIPQLNSIQSLPLNLLLVFACAAISMYLIEKPFINLGHRLASKF